MRKGRKNNKQDAKEERTRHSKQRRAEETLEIQKEWKEGTFSYEEEKEGKLDKKSEGNEEKREKVETYDGNKLQKNDVMGHVGEVSS